ncbi:MAG: tryptophan--tRNA ligase [Candidatus Nanohalarchaeota archaeon]|nr:MAG: tryptophan--tRNA ligase [Candidatus Nanohaloarchaeota archaeon]
MKKEPIVTPWDVSGDTDYNKMIKKFGLSPMGELPDAFNDNLLFRRKKIFAHRDFSRIVQAYTNKKPFVMMTGLMPSGNFHIGHMILAQQMIFYQNLGAKIYIAVADIEAYNTRGQSLEEGRKIAIEEYITNYIALGLKSKNCEIYFQSNRSNDSKKANAYYRLQNILSRHATFNEFRAVYGEISPGKMISSLLQAADMLHAQLPEFEGPMPVVVPVGIDQDPHLRLARDISKRFKMHKFTQLSSTYHLFVPGLSGGKMSSSDHLSYIALTDTPQTIREKVNKYAFSGGQPTVEEHRSLGGNPDIDVSYQWLTFLEEDDKKLKTIYNDYKAGRILSGELKAILIEKINKFLEEHHGRREKAKSKLNDFL